MLSLRQFALLGIAVLLFPSAAFGRGGTAHGSAPSTRTETLYRMGVKYTQQRSISTGEVVSCCTSTDGLYYSNVTTAIASPSIVLDNTQIMPYYQLGFPNSSTYLTIRTNLEPIIAQIYMQAGYRSIQIIDVNSIIYRNDSAVFEITLTDYVQSRDALTLDLLDSKLKNATTTLSLNGSFSSLFGNEKLITITTQSVVTDLTGSGPFNPLLLLLLLLLLLVPIGIVAAIVIYRQCLINQQRQAMMVTPAPGPYQTYQNYGYGYGSPVFVASQI